MITRLRLQNFRRHAETEIHFGSESQIVLFTGLNGRGKSSLLEAIQFSLTGEGRTTKTKLGSLVRRGAELEGLQVELDFEIGGTSYQVIRRRDGKGSYAQLFGNGIAIMQGPVQVSQEISRILGMDSKGFRLAVTAHQKELDGLADIDKSKRAATISRLLRLDAITRAKDAARAQLNIEKRVIASLGPVADAEELESERAKAEELLDNSKLMLSSAQAAVAEVTAELAASEAIEAAYQKALRDAAHAQGRATQAREARDRLAGDVAALFVPEALEAPEVSLAELEAEAAELERTIARGEAAQESRRDAQMLRGELARVLSRLAELDEMLDSLGTSESLAASRDALVQTTAELTARAAELSGTRDDLRESHAKLSQRLESATERLAANEALGASCDACGQEIGPAHREAQHTTLASEIDSLTTELARMVETGRDLSREIEAIRVRLETAGAQREALTESSRRLEAASAERLELVRRRDTYQTRLARHMEEEVDLDALFARRAQVAILRSQVASALERSRERATALSRRDDLERELERAADQLTLAERDLLAAQVDADLEAAMSRREERKEALAEEISLTGTLVTETAVAAERLTAAEAALERAAAARSRRAAHEEKARDASNAAKLLEDVESRMATQIRPALEGGVSQLLALLSDGRLDSVRINADYEVSVREDGEFQPLSEFSGGNQDLIALAIRLALASVVAERNGSGGAGFLILDEVFGSQDSERKASIITALRGLRSVYGQILVISHVAGLEDVADTVLEVSEEELDGRRVAVVSTV